MATDPRVNLGSDGPSTLAPVGYADRPVPTVRAQALSGFAPQGSGLAPTVRAQAIPRVQAQPMPGFQPQGSDLTPSFFSREAWSQMIGDTYAPVFGRDDTETEFVDETSRAPTRPGAVPLASPESQDELDALMASRERASAFGATSADRAMLGTAARAGAGVPLGSSGSVTQNLDLAQLMEGVRTDSINAFQRIQDEVAARGQATAAAIGRQTAATDARMAGAGAAVGQGGGGLDAGVLAGAGTGGAAGIRDVQATLGGFLQQSQQRRTNAMQNYIAGLEGQSQIVQDRANVVGQYMMQEREALLEQARQEDMASTVTADWVMNNIGLPFQVWEGLDADTRTGLVMDVRSGLGADGPMSEPREPGLIGQELLDAGLSEQVIPALERLEVNADRWAAGLQQTLPPEEQALLFGDNGLTPEGVRRFAEDNFIVLSEDDPRIGEQVNVNGQSRVAISGDDWQKYLQWGMGGS